MDLKFNIIGKKINRSNIQVLANKKTKCFFTFSKEWIKLEKYVIFWTKENKSIIKYLGKGDKCFCTMPPNIMKENLFSLQVYANDDYVTQKLQVGCIPEGYSIDRPTNKKKKKTFKKDDPEILLYNVFSKVDSKIDDIIYDNGYLKCYSDNRIICEVKIFENLRQEIREDIKELMPYFKMEDNGDLYAIYSYEKEINE